MIRNREHAIEVQRRRREAGKAGRSKAVRRWFKREYGRAPEAHSAPIWVDRWRDGMDAGYVREDLRYQLDGDFTTCRGFDEVHKE